MTRVWVLNEPAFVYALMRAADGDDIGVILAELYVNADINQEEPDE